MSSKVYSKGEVEDALLKKGFARVDPTDHNKYIFFYNGIETGIHTKLSFGTRKEDIRDQLFKKIKRQLKFEKSKELREYLDCDLTYEQYAQYLIGKQEIRLP